MKKRWMCCALAWLLLSGCTLRWEDAAEVWHDILTENESGHISAPASGEEAAEMAKTEPGDTSEADGDAAREALAAAALYGDLFTYSGNARLPDETIRSYLERLEEEGLAATDSLYALGFVNAGVVTDFFAKLDSGEESRLVFYELCYDGGLIRSQIDCGDSGRCVSHTRVAWRAEGPVVTYQVAYPLLELCLTAEGSLSFTSDIPNNTGGNHDGYVDPTTVIPLS